MSYRVFVIVALVTLILAAIPTAVLAEGPIEKCWKDSQHYSEADWKYGLCFDQPFPQTEVLPHPADAPVDAQLTIPHNVSQCGSAQAGYRCSEKSFTICVFQRYNARMWLYASQAIDTGSCPTVLNAPDGTYQFYYQTSGTTTVTGVY